MMCAADPNALPFSRPLAVAEVSPEGLETAIRANAEECAALAKANGLVAVARLEADFRIEREGAESFAVSGELRADVRQTCVVTLDEFDAQIVEPIELRFAPRMAVEAFEPIRLGTGLKSAAIIDAMPNPGCTGMQVAPSRRALNEIMEKRFPTL